MWYWGEAGRQHLGRVIVVGADNEYIPKLLGWETARTMDEALDMARETAPRRPEITMLHIAPICHGRRLGAAMDPKRDVNGVSTLRRRPPPARPRLEVDRLFTGVRLVVLGGTGFVGKVFWLMLLDRYPAHRADLPVRSGARPS